jgi:hypothetical protein
MLFINAIIHLSGKYLAVAIDHCFLDWDTGFRALYLVSDDIIINRSFMMFVVHAQIRALAIQHLINELRREW